MILCELDKAGAEWHIVAYLSNDANMLDVVQSGVSPHTRTGQLISRASEELVLKEDSLVGHHTDPDLIRNIREEGVPEIIDGDYYLPRTMSIRQAGKKSNHGLNYDMRYKRFALENEIQEGDAKVLVEKYHEAYPGIRNSYHKGVQAQLRRDRTLTNCFGRKRKFLEAWGPTLFDAAYAQIPQSTVYDIIRQGMHKTYYDHSKEFEPLELLSEVHDSFSFQYPVDPPRLAHVIHTIANDYLNPMCVYSSKEFYIGTTAKIGYDMGNRYEFKISPHIEEIEKSIKQALDEAETQ